MRSGPVRKLFLMSVSRSTRNLLRQRRPRRYSLRIASTGASRDACQAG